MQLKKVKNYIFVPVLLIIFSGCFLISTPEVNALGISPPCVMNHDLVKGSHFEKTVFINQGSPKEALLATAAINVPVKIKDWITLKTGTEFTIPIVRLFPVKVIVDVPHDAEPGNYNGEIRIETKPETLEDGQVSIGVGVAIALDLKVGEEEIYDFDVINVRVRPMEEGWPVKLSLDIKNKGNADAKPQKVLLGVYDAISGKLLTSAKATKFTPSHFEAFSGGDMIAEVPVDLEVGNYIAKVEIYKNEEEMEIFEIPFEVFEEGTLPRENIWVKWILIIMGGIALVTGFVWIWDKYNKQILSSLSSITQFKPSIKIEKKAVAKKIKKVKSAKKRVKKQ